MRKPASDPATGPVPVPVAPVPGPGPGYAADILALSRAAYDLVARALRSAPEVRANRVMARWPVDLEDLLLELEPMQVETPIHKLASRLGVSSAQLRSTALRLQRLSLVKVSSEGVALTGLGRQKLARLEMARASVLRRIASNLESMSAEEAVLVHRLLAGLVDHAEGVIEDQLGDGLFRGRG